VNGIQATMFLTGDGGCVVCIQNMSHSKHDNLEVLTVQLLQHSKA